MVSKRIQLGVVGRPHGVRGHVHVTSWCDDPADLTAYGPLTDAAGRVLSLRWVAEGIAAIQGVSDRDAAARLTNTPLYVDRDRLPPPDEDEVYHADLIGLAAEDTRGRSLGQVMAVHDYGAGASLEVVRQDGASQLVPFSRATAPVLDVAAGRIVLDLPDETEARP